MSLSPKAYQTIAITVAVVLVLLNSIFIPRPVRGGYQEIDITSGTGLRSIAKRLDQAGIIPSQLLFIATATLTGHQSDLKAGKYGFGGWENTYTVLRSLVRGDAISTDIEVTIPEGSNVWEVDKLFAQTGLIKEGQLAKSYLYQEGHLFPDTYRFAKDATLEDIVNKMEQNYFEKGKTRSDITIIVASMLEKEAKTEADMKLVAGIIEKRLSIGMALAIDATVGYGWCLKQFAARPNRDCDVTQAPIANEIKIDGLYNTYLRKGLPKGAISNPGIVALKAAANPQKSDYLYYLSTRDGSQIIYSKTAAEHLTNRQKYLGF